MQYVLLILWYAIQLYILVASTYVLSSAVVFLLLSPKIKRRFTQQGISYPASAQTSFTLLIPAHNEEHFLPNLLASIEQLNYPAERIRTIVIADNCTDNTALLAQQAGAICLERFTSGPSDKTQALRHVAEILPGQSSIPEMVICIIDADCVLDRNYLIELNTCYSQPNAALVMQSYRSVSNAFASPVTVLDAAAEALRQWVVAGTRDILGQSGFIFGLGCSMREAIFAELMALPITSLAEDKEWKVYLTKQNIKVAHCPTARLTYEVVLDAQAFRKQRNRWLAGYYQSLKTHGIKMLARGIRNTNLAQLDLAGDLLQPPRSVLVLATAIFGLLAYWSEGSSLIGSWGWLSLTLAFWLYGAIGMRLIGAQPRHYLLLFSGLQLLGIVAKAMLAVVLGWGIEAWEATKRESQKA